MKLDPVLRYKINKTIKIDNLDFDYRDQWISFTHGDKLYLQNEGEGISYEFDNILDMESFIHYGTALWYIDDKDYEFKKIPIKFIDFKKYQNEKIKK